MKLLTTQPPRCRGSSILVVLVLLAAMGIILVANNTTLFWLKQEIIRVEQQQIKRHGSGRDH
jgi:hypothetical protein